MTRMIVATALAAVFVVAAVAQEPVAPGKTKATAKTPKTESGRGTFKTAKERKSYVMGLDIATSLRRTGYDPADIEVSSLFRGFSDGLEGRPQLSTDEIRETMEMLQTELVARKKRCSKRKRKKTKTKRRIS